MAIIYKEKEAYIGAITLDVENISLLYLEEHKENDNFLVLRTYCYNTPEPYTFSRPRKKALALYKGIQKLMLARGTRKSNMPCCVEECLCTFKNKEAVDENKN